MYHLKTEAGDGTLGQIGINTHGAFKCLSYSQRFASLKDRLSHMKFMHSNRNSSGFMCELCGAPDLPLGDESRERVKSMGSEVFIGAVLAKLLRCIT